MSNDDETDRPPPKRGTPVSALFPRIFDNPQKQSAEHHDVIGRHGRAISYHTDRIIHMEERIKKLEKSDPHKAVQESEDELKDKITNLERDFIKLRTAVYVAAVILGSGLTGNAVSNTLKKEPPSVIQLPPEVIEALKH